MAIWGETDEFAQKTAETGKIPRIVKSPEEMIGAIDAVVVDHRHGKFHLPAAEPFLEARLPMFIDKPFSYRLAEGRDFLKRARARKVPVTSHSSVTFASAFETFRKSLPASEALRVVSTCGPCDLESPYGGIFFYGIHQVQMLVELAGHDVQAVSLAGAAGAPNGVATFHWKNGVIGAMHIVKGYAGGFQACISTEKSIVSAPIVLDREPRSTRAFCEMFRTGVEPVSHERILKQVAILEALERSSASGKLEAVEDVGL